MLTRENHIKDVYAHPIGRDIIRKILLQMGQSYHLIDNPLVGTVKLKSLPKLSAGRIDENFLDTLLELLNSEPDVPDIHDSSDTPAWWKEAVFYQIYPRSFKDSNHDGIGDLGGILEKLDYLKALGVDAVWLCPIFDSPNDDNGYDIRDYRKIMAEFGTMEEFDQLLNGLHTRNMRLILDLVISHTSDEHEWFQKALHDPDSQYGDYYFFRDQPNNWTSFFSGSAWKYYQERKQYALHLFSQKQMDLNWENDAMRSDIIAMIRWWLDKGVDGFRMDVINYLSKQKGLPDGNKSIGDLMGYCGIEHYFYGPRLHEYLRQLKTEAFAPYGAFSVGETPGIGMEMGKLLTAQSRGELDMMFSFDHLEMPGHVRFEDYRYNLNYFKQFMIDWMEHYAAHCQTSIFYENHDNPRMISKIEPDPQYRIPLAKLLAVIQMTLRGTPFIYQGQELGMINNHFASVDELRDVESLNLYAELCKTMSKEDALHKVLSGSRDHARVSMQWSSEPYGGFSDTLPWIPADDDYQICNAEAQQQDADSVLRFYQSLIQMRKKHAALVYGSIEIQHKKEMDLFTYTRKNDTETFCIECNLGSKPLRRKEKPPEAERLLSNYPASDEHLHPYEATVWMCKTKSE